MHEQNASFCKTLFHVGPPFMGHGNAETGLEKPYKILITLMN